MACTDLVDWYRVHILVRPSIRSNSELERPSCKLHRHCVSHVPLLGERGVRPVRERRRGRGANSQFEFARVYIACN